MTIQTNRIDVMIMNNTPQEQVNFNNAGLTIIELLISIVVGSLVLMMMMQMVVMNVTAKRKYEYENYVTNQSLQITDFINRSLIDLQTHHVLVENGVNTTTATFSHQFDIVYDSNIDGLIQSNANASQEILIYDEVAQTLTYEGSLIHSSSIRILPGSSITVTYFDPTYDASVCSDYNASRADQICGDGIVEIVLVLAVEFDSGQLGDEYTFTTRIIV